MRYHTYEVLKKEVNNPRLRWAYLPYSMHMAGPREAIQHMIIRKNYGAPHAASMPRTHMHQSIMNQPFYVRPGCEGFPPPTHLDACLPYNPVAT